MGLTEQHWFEDEEPELTERQLEECIKDLEKAYKKGYIAGYRDGLKKAMAEQPERIQNNAVHLCDSCQYTYVTCPSHGNDAVFGDGKGNDNICACNKYRPISAQSHDTARDITTITESEKEQPDVSDANRGDIIYRRAAIDALIVRDPNCGIDGANVIKGLPSAQPDDWMGRNKERILQAGMEGREIEFRIGGRLFAIREKAQ